MSLEKELKEFLNSFHGTKLIRPDYTTNSKSYYDYLEKVTAVLMFMSKKIDEYDGVLTSELQKLKNTLDEYLEKWDENLEKFDESVLVLLQEWMDDGTFEHIINHDVLGNKADQVELDKTNAQLTQTGSYLTHFPKLTDETDSEHINRVITELNAEGKKGLTLDWNGVYDITETVFIPSGFTLNLNNAMLKVGETVNIDVVVASTESKMKHGNIKIYNPNFDRSALSFIERNIVNFSNFEGLKIEGWWEGNLGGNGILLHARKPSDYFVYNSFEDIRITSFEYAIKFVLSKDLNPDKTGAWINGQRFNNIRFHNNKHDIYMDGDFWKADYKSENSGNLFTNLEIQLGNQTVESIHATGNSNHFHGMAWDEGHMSENGKTIVAKEKVMNNIFDFPKLQPYRQIVDTHKNDVRNYKNNYGQPTNFDRFGVPYTHDFPTFNGNQDDWLAFADKRFNINWLNGTTEGNSVKQMFEPNASATYWSGLPSNTLSKFEIVSKYEGSEIVQSLKIFGVVFDSIPKTFKLTVTDINDAEIIVIDEDNCSEKFYFGENRSNQKIKRIVVEITSRGSSMGIARLMATTNASSSVNDGGNMYVKKGGDVLWGDLNLEQGSLFMKDTTGVKRRLVLNGDGTVSASLT